MSEWRRRGRGPKKGFVNVPLMVDTEGGRLMTSGEGQEREVSFKIVGEGSLEMTREVSGADWRVGTGKGAGEIDFFATGAEMKVATFKPLMVLACDRQLGSLREVVISGIDVAALAGAKALESGDWGNIGDMKQIMEDRFLRLVFTPEGGLQFAILESVGRELGPMKTEDEQNLGADSYGFLPERRNYLWMGNLGFLKGRVGFEVFADRVVFFYEKGEGEKKSRRNVMEIPRIIPGTIDLDRTATAGMPKEDDLLEFMEKVWN